MARRFLLPLLALTLLAAEAAHAQTAAAPTQPGYVKARKTKQVLSKREQKAADAAARAQAAASQPVATAAPTSWSGWSDDALPFTPTNPNHHVKDDNLSVAPGMPINQLGHGVSTDYHGRPLTPAVASSTTLPNVR